MTNHDILIYRPYFHAVNAEFASSVIRSNSRSTDESTSSRRTISRRDPGSPRYGSIPDLDSPCPPQALAALVQDRRVGKNIYYSWTPAGPIKEPELRSVIRLAVADMPEAASDRSGLKHVIAKRRDRTREYFNKLAGKFGRSFCPGRSWQALAHLLITLIPPIDVADLGAGEGTLSQLLAKRARKVIAIDISERMIEVGTQLAKDHGFTNLEYRLGDLEEPPIADSSIDLAIFSQALHHANSPHKAIAAAERILRPGGRVVILDLLAHNYRAGKRVIRRSLAWVQRGRTSSSAGTNRIPGKRSAKGFERTEQSVFSNGPGYRN